jgi:FlaG/FlaF family flagellin (archaellin)
LDVSVGNDAWRRLERGEGYYLSRRQWLLAAAGVVVVAVVLAAFVGAFVLGSTGGTIGPPQATFQAGADPGVDGWGTGDETVVVKHYGGDELQTDEFELTASEPDDGGMDALRGVDWPTEGWSAGETVTYTGTTSKDETLMLVWRNPNGDAMEVLWEGDLVDLADGALPSTATSTPSTTTDAPTTTDDESTTHEGGGTEVRDAEVVAFAASSAQRSYSRQSQSATAVASRSCAVS